MKKLISALWLVSTLATGAAWAQPYAPNDAGVTNGHWHLNSRDVAANKHILLAMGGVAAGPGERVVFPGVQVILNQGPTARPSTGATSQSLTPNESVAEGVRSIRTIATVTGSSAPSTSPLSEPPADHS